MSPSPTPINGKKRPRPRMVKLALADRRSAPSPAVDFPLDSEDEGIDLGAIGRALGLEPTTVRLNGHFISRGPHLVSRLTWASILSFFTARGLPAGASDRDPVAVQGKPAAAASSSSGLQHALHLEDEEHLFCERKIELEDGNPFKRNRTSLCTSNSPEVGKCTINDEQSICFGTRLKLDDDQQPKKRKISHHKQGLIGEAAKPIATAPPGIGFSYNCISGFKKRFREEEMVVPVACKRIR